MKKRQIIIISVILIIIFSSVALMQYFTGMRKKPQKVAVSQEIRLLKTLPIVYRSVPTQIVTFGRVNSFLSLDVIPEVGGRIILGEIPLKEGQNFLRDMILFKIDYTEALLNLRSQRSSFLKDLSAILPDFKIDFTQSFSTWQKYFQSIDVEKPLPDLPPVISAQEKTYLATKNIFTSYYSIKSKEINLKKYTIRAPFDGIITQVDFQVGSFVNPGTKVAKVIETSNLEIKATINIEEVKWIKKGQKVIVSTEDQMSQWKGKVVRIGQVINPDTQSLNIFISVKKNQNPIYEGMYLQVSIPGEVVENAMEVDRRSLFDENRVYIIQDSLLKSKEVTVHKINPESAIISGLKPGTDLVIEPLINAYENMKTAKLPNDQDLKIN